MLNILCLLVIIAYTAANIIMTTLSIQYGSTIKEILDEQDFGLGFQTPTFSVGCSSSWASFVENTYKVSDPNLFSGV